MQIFMLKRKKQAVDINGEFLVLIHC